MHIDLTGLDAYIEDRVVEKDIRRKIKAQAGQSFLNARLLVDQWLRYKDQAMFDTQDHIRKCEIEFYDSLQHGMSEAGLISLAIVAADRPIRFEELADAVHVLTGTKLSMSDLLHQTSHLIDISWEQVPEIKVLHPTIMAYLREEADLPIIDMTELCQYGIDHDGPFKNYALRNWSSFGTSEKQLACFDHYLNHFDDFREDTFLALNDDTRVKFYGTTVDHLKAWHGLEVSSNEPDQLGNFPIHIAAARGHAALVEKLEYRLDRRRRSAFEVALEANKIDVCKVLPMELGLAIERKPELAEQYMVKAAEKDIMNDMHALHTAIRLGKNDLIAMFPKRDRKAEVLLLQNSPELLQDIDDDLLKYANETTVEYLQSKGQEKHVEILSTPLHAAVLEESSSLLKYANELDGDGRTSLWNAIDEDDDDRFDLLLKHTDVDHVDNTGDTVLVYACDNGREDLALRVLQKSKRPSSESLAKLLRYSIETNEPESVLLSLSKGAHLWEYAKLGKLPSETASLRRASKEMVGLVEELEQRFIKGDKIDDICSREIA
ncbi:hypothetical protein AMS68_007664 [Peltaster fructicola]|uniref:Uncharacterized protein n=1 Tax=Peltaster fructicola TaxID=286661 RepID=A0A6H0Y527_9PEZI|nr:hypothetical protein AMS68_007664 [Peltaster fructicola]